MSDCRTAMGMGRGTSPSAPAGRRGLAGVLCVGVVWMGLAIGLGAVARITAGDAGGNAGGNAAGGPVMPGNSTGPQRPTLTADPEVAPALVDDGGAPWVAIREQADAAWKACLQTQQQLQDRFDAEKKTDAATQAFLAGRKEARDQYLATLKQLSTQTIQLAPGVSWTPVAARYGLEMLEDGQFPAAVASYEQSILIPYQAHSNPAKCGTWLSQLDGLPAPQRKYLALQQAWSCYRLATLYERCGRPKEAVALYENALTLDRRPRFMLALALAYTLHADFEKARGLLADASQVTGQKSVLIEYELAYCLEKLWLLDEAHAAYARALAQAKKSNELAQGDATATAAATAAVRADGLGFLNEAAAPQGWNLDIAPVLIEQADRRVVTAQEKLTPGNRDGSHKAYDLFKQAGTMNLTELPETVKGLDPAVVAFEQDKLFDQYENLISQAVVAYPRFVPALVKAGIIKLNRDQPDQALSLFQAALSADKDDPAALIYFAQTALKMAGHDLSQIHDAVAKPAPRPAGDPTQPAPPAVRPTLALEQATALLAEADGYLKPLPDLGKRLARILDKHAIGYEISALAQIEQVHANSYRKNDDLVADQSLLEQAHQDYQRARARGGAPIDLFEKVHTHEQAPTTVEQPVGPAVHGPVRP